MAREIFEVEIREGRPGREGTLHGVMLTEGRAASERKELFVPGSVEWPSNGVAILTEHRGAVETRGQVVRGRDGALALTARATDAIRAAVKAGKRYMSVEFRALKENRTRGGIREIERAFVDAAALTASPEYTQTGAELRSKRRPVFWL